MGLLTSYPNNASPDSNDRLLTADTDGTTTLTTLAQIKDYFGDDAKLTTYMKELLSDAITSGAVWTQTTGRTGAMTAGVGYLSGHRFTIPAITSKTFTASKDTYIFLDSTGAPNYQEVTVGSNIPTNPTNTVRGYKVTTDASTILSILDVSQKPVTSNKVDWTTFPSAVANNAYSSTTVTSSGTSTADLTFAAKTANLLAGKYLIIMDAQSSMPGFTFYSLRFSGAATIAPSTYASGVGNSNDVHNIFGMAVISIPTSGTYVITPGIAGDNGSRSHSAYNNISFALIPVFGSA